MQNAAKLIGQQIRNIRSVNGITLEELAERAALSSGFVSELERGKKSPSVEALIRIAEALDVTVLWLMAPLDHLRTGKISRFEVLGRLQRVMKEFYSPEEVEALLEVAQRPQNASKAAITNEDTSPTTRPRQR